MRPADPAAARFRKVSRAASCLLCGGVALVNFLNLDGLEFAGGGVTGRLLDADLAGAAVLLAAAGAVLLTVRVGAALAILGAAGSVPLYAYLLDPSLFDGFGLRSVVGDVYVLDEWAALGLVTIAVMAFAFVRPPRGGRGRRGAG